MAILDTTRKPFIEDRDNSIFVGIDYPFSKSNKSEGWFKSTESTIDSVKNNIKLLLSTEKGERLMQPNLGLGLRKRLFEQITQETIADIKNDIQTAFSFWLPFVEIKQLEIVTQDDENNINSNSIIIKLLFNITKAPNTLESVQVEISGE
jgi:phage baseplate assembly protein W|tara:strand:- start:63 stop:512 length:450 start_codon:yes stop_codon:yes gene_type:complete